MVSDSALGDVRVSGRTMPVRERQGDGGAVWLDELRDAEISPKKMYFNTLFYIHTQFS